MTPAATDPGVPHRDISCRAIANPDAFVRVRLLIDAIRYSYGSHRLRGTRCHVRTHGVETIDLAWSPEPLLRGSPVGDVFLPYDVIPSTRSSGTRTMAVRVGTYRHVKGMPETGPMTTHVADLAGR